MKIAIDIRSLQDKKHSGVQEYVLSTLRELFELDRENQYTLFSIGARRFSSEIVNELASKKSNVTHRHIFWPNKALSFLWYFSNVPNLRKILGNPDKVFAPNLNVFPKDILKITTITFHDLSFKYFSIFFSPKSRLWHRVIRPKRLAKKADQIIAVSESTKNDVIESYKIDKKKISHIPLGRDERLGIKKDSRKLKNIKKKYNLPDKFILFVGTLEPRKNIIGTIRAFNLLLEKNKELRNHRLVLAGPRGWRYKKIIKAARASSHNDKILFTGPIERSERAFIYNIATLFIYPSFFEGFGLPLLEAMACGTPIVTSNRSSISSVVGDSAVMIDPYRIGEIAWAMESVLLDKELSSWLSKKGIEQSREFSWANTAQKLKKILEKNHVKI